MQFQRSWVLWTLLGCIWLSAMAQAVGIDSKMRAEDKRLEKPITINGKRLYLTELLHRLSLQTGVNVTISDQDAASGVQITCHCENVPLGDVLDGLYGLVSNRNGEWLWRRGGHPGAFNYVLSEPTYARERTARLRDYAETALENYINVIIEFAEMSPEERQRNKRRLKQAISADDDTLVERLLAGKNRWNAVRLFAATVPPEERLMLLRNGKKFTVTVSDLPPQTQELLRIVFASFHSGTVLSDGTVVPDPEPKTLTYSANSVNGVDRALLPNVCVTLGDNSTVTFMGSSYLEEGIFAAIKKMWMLPSDTADNFASQRIVTANTPETIEALHDVTLANGKTLHLSSFPHSLETRLTQLSQGSALSTLILLPTVQSQDFGTPVSQSVQAYLSKIGKDPIRPITKWRNGLLLVNYAGWFLEDDTVVAYSLIRQYLRSKDGVIQLVDLAKLMSSITDEQTRRLAEDFPVLQAALKMRPLFALYKQFPSIISLDGTRLDGQMIAALNMLPHDTLPEAIANGTATALRLSQKQTRIHERTSVLIRLEGLVLNKWMPFEGFTQVSDITTK